MKNDFIKILANLEDKKATKVYNELLEKYAQVSSVREVYHYQLGYTPTKLDNLKYEIQKKLGISDKEIALFVPSEADEVLEEVKTVLTPEQIQAATEAYALEVARIKQNENPILSELQSYPNAQEGLKLRDEYPFLNDEHCPNEFKILVSDKITAYKSYAAKHAEALEAADLGDAEDKLYELAKSSVENYQLNQDIKAELDFFRDSNGKVLGKHPLLADLKLQQEVKEMSEADLLKARNNGLKSVNLYKDKADKERLYNFHTKKLDLVTNRLINDFNMTFDKK